MTESLEAGTSNRGAVAEGRVRPGWRFLENVTLLVLLGVGLYYLVPKLIGDREMLQVVKRANLLLVPAALALEGLSMLSVCRLYHLALALGGGTLPFSRVSLVYMSAYAFGHVVPGGNAGTFYLNYRELRREGVSRGLAVKAISASFVFYSLGMVVVLVLGLLLGLIGGGLPRTYGLVVASISAGALLFAVLCAVIFRRGEGLLSLTRFLLGAARRLRLPSEKGEELERWVGEARDYFRSVFSSRRDAFRLIFYGTGFWLLDMACLYLVFLALGHPVNPGLLIVGYALADIVGSLPLTPAGLGVFEVSLGALLLAFGNPKEVVVTAVLGFRFFSYWLCTLAGGLCYLALRLERRRERKRMLI